MPTETRIPVRATDPAKKSIINIKNNGGPYTLAIDIGGTGLKATVLDKNGNFVVDRVRVETPVGAPPQDVVELLRSLVDPLPGYDRVSVGFPGVVRGGRILTAANLGHDGWIGYDLATSLQKTVTRPVRVMNDADLQGLGAIRGAGVEIVLTLGTGFGSGVYLDGRVGPHLELAHHPFRKGETYEQQLGNAARKEVGNRKWNRRVERAISQLHALLHFDELYLGGGNSKHLDFEPPKNVNIIENAAGLSGGVALWRE